MTYSELNTELQKRRDSSLYSGIMTIVDAVNRLPEETREKHRDWMKYFRRLSMVAGNRLNETEYNTLRESIFQGVSEHVANYDFPTELLARKEVRTAMEAVFTALELDGREIGTPCFAIAPTDLTDTAAQKEKRQSQSDHIGAVDKERESLRAEWERRENDPNGRNPRTADAERARQALKRDPLGYGAQCLAFMNAEEKLPPKAMFEALSQVALLKKDRTMQMVMAQENTRDYLFNGELEYFKDQYTYQKRDEVDPNTLSFKAWSDKFAKEYRNRQISYTELEMRMNALRAAAAEADPDAGPRERDSVPIYFPDYEAKLNAARKAEAARQVSPEAFQRQLAESYDLGLEASILRIEEVYGAKPVFHEEFVRGKVRGYERDNFARSLPEVDLSETSFGREALSNEEFASLATLAVYDPRIGGAHLIGSTELIDIAPPSAALSNNYHFHRVANFGNTSVVIDGKQVVCPDNRAGLFIASEVGPARQKVADALKEYDRQNSAPLCEIIKYGLQCATDHAQHFPEKRKLDPNRSPIRPAEDSPLNLVLNKGNAINERMLQGTLALLDRSPGLRLELVGSGCSQETIDKARGLLRGHQVVKAGEAALGKLLAAADGGKQLSGFEKAQCVIAVQRRNALLKSLDDAYRQATADSRYQKAVKAYEDKQEKILEKYSGVRSSPEKEKELTLAECAFAQTLTEISGTPAVYARLGGKEGAAALDRMLPEGSLSAERAAEMSAAELVGELGARPKQEIKTTAKELYDTLTKQYQKGEINYTFYETRLRAMRELTNGSKRARIDLDTVENYILAEQERKKDAMDKAMDKMLQAEYEGYLGGRLRGIYDIYGLTPKANAASLRNKAYSQAEFDTLKPVREVDGETCLHLAADEPAITQDDFAALAIAVTQACPEVGGAYFYTDEVTDELTRLPENPTLADAFALRALYLTDACRDAQGARVGFNNYLTGVVRPAREKAEEALRQFGGGKGSPAELGRILGMGLHNLVNTTYLMTKAAEQLGGDNALEGAVAARLAGIIEKHPDLEKEALKYASKEDLAKARGLKIVYDITRAAREAEMRLKKSVEKKTPLPEAERKACIELMLRNRFLVISAKLHARNIETGSQTDKLTEEFMKMDKSTLAKSSMATTLLSNRINQEIGLPDFVKTLGNEGPGFVRAMLDQAMPNREAFFARKDAEILKAMESKLFSAQDPFQNREYQKKAAAPAGTVREIQKTAPQADSVRKR